MSTDHTPMPPDLLPRLSAATGPSRELDAEIALALGWTNLSPPGITGWWAAPNGRTTLWMPRFTASIDAALTLMPEGKMWFLGHMDPGDMRFAATISELGHIGVDTWRGHHTEAAIALIIAILKARHP